MSFSLSLPYGYCSRRCGRRSTLSRCLTPDTTRCSTASAPEAHGVGQIRFYISCSIATRNRDLLTKAAASCLPCTHWVNGCKPVNPGRVLPRAKESEGRVTVTEADAQLQADIATLSLIV